MSNRARFPVYTAAIVRRLALLVCVAVCTTYSLRAGETTDGKAVTTTEETPEYKNWIELGIGGTIVNGDNAQFEQEHRLPANTAYGGIQDLHFEQTFDKNGLFSIDGHALWDLNDYDVTAQLSKPKLGYVKAGFTEFRSWYDGNGGFFPHNDVFFSPPFPEMHIDRGDVWVELGLRVPNWPEITIRYSHEFRQGMKDSTIWGDTTLTGLAVNPTRKIIPSFRDIDETRDIFSFEASKTIGNTDVLLGMRYEHNENDDSLNMERGAGQLQPVVRPPGSQRFVTQHEKNDVDLFSGHGITETRITDTLWFTEGMVTLTKRRDRLAESGIEMRTEDAGAGEAAERLELRYTGIDNWLFYAEGEWEEEYGHVNEFQNIDEAEEPLDKDTNALGQKYTIGANWYPMMRLNLSGQYFHRIASYDEDIISGVFPRLINQDWNIDDLNVRITFRPKIPACLATLALVTRYDFVHTEIDSQWFHEGETMAELETGEIKKHVISESLTWNPLARFYLQANFSYVFNQTDTPASNINLDPQTSPHRREL